MQWANDTERHTTARDRVERREARVMAEGVEMEQQPEALEREADVPENWEQTLDMREQLIEELLG